MRTDAPLQAEFTPPPLPVGPGWATRTGRSTDHPYIANTLAREFSLRVTRFRGQEHARLRDLQHGERDIARALVQTASILAAHSTEEPSVLCGWALHEPGVLHYLYVRRQFRGLCIGRALLTALATPGTDGLQVTHLTAPGRNLLARTGTRYRFVPWRAVIHALEPT